MRRLVKIIGMSLLVIIGNIFAITNAEDSTNREDQIAWNPISTEFTRVQSGDWINSDVFAVGDGMER